MSKQYVVYYRVSTKKQGDSGLGLEAQHAYIRHFLTAGDIAAEFTEVESGKTVADRPQLKAALKLCGEQGYGLAVAKIDRLSRTTEHALAIWSQLDGYLYACDIPTERGGRMDKFMLTIYMAIADRERELISIRTKQALDAKRAKNGEWRVSNLTDADRLSGSQTMRERAVEAYRSACFTAKMLREQGMSYRDIADQLNANGYKTRRGKEFHATTVSRMLSRGCQ